MPTDQNTAPYTWQGKGLRLLDLLDSTERKAVLQMFPSEAQFKAANVKSDATELVKYAVQNNLLDDAGELMECHVWSATLAQMGYEVKTAMDGRLEVGKLGSRPSVRGTIPPGSRGKEQIAHDYLMGLAAQGLHPEFPVKQTAHKPLVVSDEFAKYLRANGELVRTIERDAQRDVINIWPAMHDQQMEVMLRQFQLASLGANDPDGGQLGKVIAAKAPKQFAIWKSGCADQWRMMEALRESLLRSASDMTSGNFADKQAGGALTEGLRHFQRGFQAMAEDALSGVPSLRAADALADVCNQVIEASKYLENSATIREVPVAQAIIDSMDLAATIAVDLRDHYLASENARAAQSPRVVRPEAGLA